MELIIRNSGGQPIYDQIRTQIKAMILSGQMPPGTPLPSIRALAKDLKISVITTKRAYDELESEGFLVTVPGKGSFVAEQNLELVKEQRLRDVEDLLRQGIELGLGCGLNQADLTEMFRILLLQSTLPVRGSDNKM